MTPNDVRTGTRTGRRFGIVAGQGRLAELIPEVCWSAADVDAVVRQRLLEVVDGAADLERAEDALGDVPVLDARHPEPHRAEERLDDDVGAEGVERFERVVPNSIDAE